jgi:hypothetical protein
MPSLLSTLRRTLRPTSGPHTFDAARYWDARYTAGGTSGDGSYGRLAVHKAEVINRLISEHGLASGIEFGCGDGAQLGMLRFPRYTGLDVAASAVQRCGERYRDDNTKAFFLYDSLAFYDAPGVFAHDASLSLDVVYHITDDVVYDRYMQQVCDAATRLVILYATDEDRYETTHVRHRLVSQWVARQRPALKLLERIKNPYPGTGEQESDADFLIYGKS